MKGLIALICASLLASSVAAQTRRPVIGAPSVSLRPFVVLSEESFTARTTFNAIFGQSLEPWWGGGLQLAFKDGSYLDVTAWRFKKSGQRAFFFNGQSFPLGIPLTTTLTPLEVTAGRRFMRTSRAIPYVGAGIGSYRYQESSQFDDGAFDVRHVGYFVVGGAELRLSRWLGVSGDVQYTRVPGILGNGGVSKDAGDTDLGGIAGRFRVIVGR